MLARDHGSLVPDGYKIQSKFAQFAENELKNFQRRGYNPLDRQFSPL